MLFLQHYKNHYVVFCLERIAHQGKGEEAAEPYMRRGEGSEHSQDTSSCIVRLEKQVNTLKWPKSILFQQTNFVYRLASAYYNN